VGRHGLEIVVLDKVRLDTSGLYKCEVLADANFQTEFKEANMTVVYTPDVAPIVKYYPPPRSIARDRNMGHGSQGGLKEVRVGDQVNMGCTAPAASPPLSV
ncbi:unnamed protein product, partial [Meganyctiphanes norvegica]